MKPYLQSNQKQNLQDFCLISGILPKKTSADYSALTEKKEYLDFMLVSFYPDLCAILQKRFVNVVAISHMTKECVANQKDQ